jgi:hypothetical protein
MRGSCTQDWRQRERQKLLLSAAHPAAALPFGRCPPFPFSLLPRYPQSNHQKGIQSVGYSYVCRNISSQPASALDASQLPTETVMATQEVALHVQVLPDDQERPVHATIKATAPEAADEGEGGMAGRREQRQSVAPSAATARPAPRAAAAGGVTHAAASAASAGIHAVQAAGSATAALARPLADALAHPPAASAAAARDPTLRKLAGKTVLVVCGQLSPLTAALLEVRDAGWPRGSCLYNRRPLLNQTHTTPLTASMHHHCHHHHPTFTLTRFWWRVEPGTSSWPRATSPQVGLSEAPNYAWAHAGTAVQDHGPPALTCPPT